MLNRVAYRITNPAPHCPQTLTSIVVPNFCRELSRHGSFPIIFLQSLISGDLVHAIFSLENSINL